MAALRLLARICILVAFAFLMAAATNGSPAPKRDINAVLADVSDRLLAIPGVVGIYVGVREDGKTACLKVMLSDAKAEPSIPKTIEGYAVVVEITGEIRPLGK